MVELLAAHVALRGCNERSGSGSGRRGINTVADSLARLLGHHEAARGDSGSIRVCCERAWLYNDTKCRAE